MAEIKIAGVMRAGAYSPNHIGNDAAIFNIAADQLRKRGCEVTVFSEEQLASGATDGYHIIMNMCRERRSIDLLQKREDAGDLVINSGYGIENCTRERMTRILIGNGIPYPESLMVNTDESVIDALEKAGIEQCWIKRGDFHAMHKEDVSLYAIRKKPKKYCKNTSCAASSVQSSTATSKAICSNSTAWPTQASFTGSIPSKPDTANTDTRPSTAPHAA